MFLFGRLIYATGFMFLIQLSASSLHESWSMDIQLQKPWSRNLGAYVAADVH